MRNKLFGLSFLLLLVGMQHATAQIKPGFRLGLNYAETKNFNIVEHNGFHVGTYLNISLAGIAALEPGAQFSQRKLPFVANGTSSQVTLGYFDFPLIFRLSVLPFVNVFGGPQASVLVGEKYKGPGSFDFRKSLPNEEMGGIAGVAVKLPLGLNVQASYDFGLSELEYNGISRKNRIFKISLGKDF